MNTSFFVQAIKDAVVVQGNIENPTFSIDSRTIERGSIFIPLAGGKVDGHDFISDALDRGASGVVIASSQRGYIDSLRVPKDIFIAVVPDTLEALVELASAWRAQFLKPVIAITGSVGKTSTKALLASIISESGKHYFVAHGNQNTLIGVALNILKMTADHEGALFEVGISKRGEMARIVKMLRPTYAAITMIGHGHLAGLGSLEEVAAEKRTIFSHCKSDDIGFVNGDQPLLARVAYTHPVVKFGLKMTNHIQARKINGAQGVTSFILKMYGTKYPVTIPYIHHGVINNALLAAAIAYQLGIPVPIICKALERPVVVPGRFEKKSLAHARGFVIHDCYNANPESMKAALLAFHALETAAKKVLVLGDMLELGGESDFWHRQIGRFLRKTSSVRHVILVGSQVSWIRKVAPVGLSIEQVPSWKEAIECVKKQFDSEVALLIKGSRGMQLDQLVDYCTRPLQESK